MNESNNPNNIVWMEDKILHDQSLGARLYYTKEGSGLNRNYQDTLNTNDYLITVGTCVVSPSFSISHEWSNVMTSGLASVFNTSISYIQQLLASTESSISGSSGIANLLGKMIGLVPGLDKFSPSGDGSFKSSIISNIITSSYHDLFKQYSGTRVNISIPDLVLYLLPTDSPNNREINFKNTPLYRLKKLLNWTPKKEMMSKDNKKMTDVAVDYLSRTIDQLAGVSGLYNSLVDISKPIYDKVANTNIGKSLKASVDKSRIIIGNINKLIDNKTGSLMGDTFYIKSLMVSTSPLSYRRGFNYDDDPRLQGTCLLKVNGVNYPNLLISDINVNYSQTKLIDNDGVDYGPSWIRVVLSFVPAIDYTIRDIHRMIGDKLDSLNLSSVDLTINGIGAYSIDKYGNVNMSVDEYLNKTNGSNDGTSYDEFNKKFSNDETAKFNKDLMSNESMNHELKNGTYSPSDESISKLDTNISNKVSQDLNKLNNVTDEVIGYEELISHDGPTEHIDVINNTDKSKFNDIEYSYKERITIVKFNESRGSNEIVGVEEKYYQESPNGPIYLGLVRKNLSNDPQFSDMVIYNNN